MQHQTISLSDPYADASTKKLVASFSVPLKDHPGVVAADISLDKLSQGILSTKFEVNSFSFIVSPKGDFLTYLEKNKISKNISIVIPNLNLTQIQSLSGDIKLMDLSFNNQDWLISSTKLPNLNWYIFTFIDKHVVLPVNQILLAIFTVTSIVVLSLQSLKSRHSGFQQIATGIKGMYFSTNTCTLSIFLV